MPANLPPQYYALEKEFNKETDLHEKLRMAQELLTIMPKHKGTDKLQAEMKAKISKLKKQIDDGGKKSGIRHADPHSHIDKEGAGQIILIGPPNSGKSSLLESLTNAKPLIADYPFATREPMTGMMFYETVHLQLIDTPAISDDQTPPYLPNLIRQADIVVLICDISADNFEDCIREAIDYLGQKNIILTSNPVAQGDDTRMVYKKTIIAANKYLEDESGQGLEELRKKHTDFIIVPVSILDDESLNKFKTEIFRALNIIRVYTKRIGHEVEFVDPIILPVGGTVEDAAVMLHKDFAYKLQFAKVWGKGKFEGQRVKNSYTLSDGDIIEFHI